MARADNRGAHAMRPLTFTSNTFSQADASVLVEYGNTKVLCAVTLQNGVPPFLRGSGTGWLTAEYAMLPTATPNRVQREVTHRSGRSVEISRLIGRALRSVCEFSVLGERTMLIDCDVLQADGSTRTAAITGASCALQLAQQLWLSTGKLKEPCIKESIFAVSVGKVNDQWLLDIDYKEDSAAGVDFNIVVTLEGKVIEIQGCAEQSPFDWNEFQTMRLLVEQGRKTVQSVVGQFLASEGAQKHGQDPDRKVPFFSLQNRQIQR